MRGVHIICVIGGRIEQNLVDSLNFPGFSADSQGSES